MTSNRLASAGSAYLQSAAHQPIHWYPWSEEAFAAARAQDRPVLLDIGAVWCHWCHVMDGESYEDPGLARYLNENFVCIKVDRDERPDVDARYQRAVQALHPPGRLAAHRLPHARRRGVLRRHLLPTRGEVRAARLPDRARRACSRRTARGGARSRRRRRRSAKVLDAHLDESAPGEASPALLTQAEDGDRAGVRPGERRVRQPAQVSPPGRRHLPAAPLARPARGSHPRRSSTARSRAWPAAACTTSSAAGSTATAWTPSGSCPTSRRCRTTTRSCSRRTSTRTPRSGRRSTPRWRAGSCAGCARCASDPGGGLRREPGRRRRTRRRRRLLHLDPRGGGGGALGRRAGRRGGVLRHRHRRRDAPQPGQERPVRGRAARRRWRGSPA